MSEGSGGPDLDQPGLEAAEPEQEYRLRQPIGDGRRTVTVRMPKGWIRAALSGVEGALLSWAVPALFGIFGLLTEGSNPWFQEVDVSAAASIGTNYWALSLGAPMSIGGLPISLIPLLWTVAEILILRGLMISGRDNQASAQWFAVPFYALTSLVILLSSPGTAEVGAVLIGSTFVALIAATWAVVSQTDRWPEWTAKVSWLWKGVRLALIWFGVTALVGVLAFVVSIFSSWSDVNHVSQAVGASGFSAFLLWITQASYLLVFAGWGLAWLAGPGFTLSGGEVSSPTSVASGSLPAFPITQAVPGTAPGNWVVLVLVVLAIGVGVLCGRWLKQSDIRYVALEAISALLVFSALIGGWFTLSTGALGTELMARLGPTPTAWPMVSLVFGLVVAVSYMGAQSETIRLAKQVIRRWRMES
ncbi:DUF6350 family protein [Actinomycetaceae bacterium MB13-C1-2]|nr:DUF6350 family protein [Actinomycetaceae bacterium MB13-C1-2]